VVIDASAECVHEMLCRGFANRFDNRMLQVKNQLRGNPCGLVRRFPLLYSKNINDEKYGQTNADAPNRWLTNAGAK
jgi:hypothetical protein